MYWYEKAAKQGNAEAQLALDDIYKEKSASKGIKKGDRISEESYKKRPEYQGGNGSGR